MSGNWSAEGYRLPSEMEWMFAAKGGNLSQDYTYSGSNDINAVAWYGDIWGPTHAVGSLTPNELGIFDMSGNVEEWCWDIYGEYPAGNQINPHGPTAGTDRAMRGGWRQSSPSGCTVWSRNLRSPDGAYNTMGVRLVRNVPQ
jgi:formylglycine-generating enzyme